MAHFAKLDENNVVLEVVVVSNDVLEVGDGQEEARGIAFLKKLYGPDTRWLQTSYNSNLRKNYATLGGIYDAARDAFIAPQPYPSWILDEELCAWDAPTPYPASSKPFVWNERFGDWVVPHA